MPFQGLNVHSCEFEVDFQLVRSKRVIEGWVEVFIDVGGPLRHHIVPPKVFQGIKHRLGLKLNLARRTVFQRAHHGLHDGCPVHAKGVGSTIDLNRRDFTKSLELHHPHHVAAQLLSSSPKSIARHPPCKASGLAARTVCKIFCTLIMYKSNNVHIWIMLCMIMFSAHCVMYIIATLL
jgi:hypothetical protein